MCSAPWTLDDVPDLRGRTAIVTGANSGLGYEDAKLLAMHGAHVVLACRSPQRGEAAAQELRAGIDDADVVAATLDLADLGSVRAFARAVRETESRLDVLVDNAGVMAIPRARTADGFEMQLGTNHLGHFALTGLVLDLLLATPGSRVVTVTSLVHRVGRIDFDDLQHERRYRKWAAYAQSKLANLLFTFELQRRATAAGVDLRSLAAHPGYASTHLQAAGPQLAGNRLMERAVAWSNRRFAQPATDGALPTVRAATDPDVAGGECFGPAGFAERAGPPVRVSVSDRAHDPDVARRLWDVSVELTGVDYAALEPR